MKEEYRGHSITVNKEKNLVGCNAVYFSVVRNSDGYVLEDSLDYNETVRDMMKHMKYRVDQSLDAECEVCGFTGEGFCACQEA
jgi:hypothetical protein